MRVVGRDFRDKKNPQLTATQVVWATIHSHTIMDEYMRRNFFEHPSISAVIACHLASHHTRPDSAFVDRLNRVENTIARLTTKMDNLESRLANLEGKQDPKNDSFPFTKNPGRETERGKGSRRQDQGRRVVLKNVSCPCAGTVPPAPIPLVDAPPAPFHYSLCLVGRDGVAQTGVLPIPKNVRPLACVVIAHNWPCWTPVLACFPGLECRVYSHLCSAPFEYCHTLPHGKFLVPPFSLGAMAVCAAVLVGLCPHYGCHGCSGHGFFSTCFSIRALVSSLT